MPHSPIYPVTHSLIHLYTHSLTHSVTHSPFHQAAYLSLKLHDAVWVAQTIAIQGRQVLRTVNMHTELKSKR